MKALLRIYKKSYQKKYCSFSILAILFIFCDIMISLLIPYLSKSIIDVAIPKNDLSKVYEVGSIVIGIALAAVISTILNNLCAQWVATSIAADIRDELFEKIQELSLSDVDRISTGKLMTIVTNDTNQIQQILLFSFRAILRAPLTLLGAMVMAYITNRDLFIIVLIALPLLAIIFVIIFKKASPLFNILQTKVDNLNTKLSETIGGAREVKAFVTALEELEKFDVVNNEYNEATIKANKAIVLVNPFVILISNIAIGMVLYISSLMINYNHSYMAGTIMTYISYVQQIIISLTMISTISIILSRAMISAKRIENVLNVKVDIKNSEDLEDIEIKGNIEFKNVSFAYPDEEGRIDGITIKDINFKINQNERIGLIGSTGSGKSSLVVLIPRMYDTLDGEVLIDGVNVRNINISNLRASISFVTQEAIIFEGTFKSNILQGKKDATNEEIEIASKLANANQFIDESINGYDSEVSQGGSNLSGGQRQRLSLARALIRKPKILILDDSTSAVDAKTEKLIKDNLNSITNTTIIIVSQKISSIIDCNKIIVLNNSGQIDGFDNHTNLLKTSVVYQEIYQSQFGGGINER